MIVVGKFATAIMRFEQLKHIESHICNLNLTLVSSAFDSLAHGVVSASFHIKLYIEVAISMPCNSLHKSHVVHSAFPVCSFW